MKKVSFIALLLATFALTACGSGTTTTTTTTTTGSNSLAPQILGTSLGQGRIKVTTNVAAQCTFSYNQNGVPGSLNLTQTSDAGYVYQTALASGTYNNVKLSCSNTAGTTVDSTYNGGNITVSI